ncbi:hypothetical protein Ciccas_001188 [Cichlidogyrus casuarinus]|uniref:Uncharacterized protein n=1 Tax=Cichlidogyrus casuarinus TaxID=1844966 RepID=A0ABD2QNS3_9PLAT
MSSSIFAVPKDTPSVRLFDNPFGSTGTPRIDAVPLLSPLSHQQSNPIPEGTTIDLTGDDDDEENLCDSSIKSSNEGYQSAYLKALTSTSKSKSSLFNDFDSTTVKNCNVMDLFAYSSQTSNIKNFLNTKDDKDVADTQVPSSQKSPLKVSHNKMQNLMEYLKATGIGLNRGSLLGDPKLASALYPSTSNTTPEQPIDLTLCDETSTNGLFKYSNVAQSSTHSEDIAQPQQMSVPPTQAHSFNPFLNLSDKSLTIDGLSALYSIRKSKSADQSGK